MYIHNSGKLLCDWETARRIQEILQDPSAYYLRYDIPKKSGGTRKICAPLPVLKEIQQQILRDIFYAKGIQFQFPKSVCAFLPKRSIVENAAPHVGKEMVLCMDIRDFFASVTEKMVCRCLIEDFPCLRIEQESAHMLAQLCTLQGVLPQGAPTSPFLANMVFRRVDYRLEGFAKSSGLSYTRYADDLTFSGAMKKEKVIHFVRDILFDYGFLLQSAKTHAVGRNERQMVTGLVVNDRVQVPKSVRRKLRQSAYYIDRFGVEDFLRHEKKQREYLNVLQGWCAFVLQTGEDKAACRLKELLAGEAVETEI